MGLSMALMLEASITSEQQRCNALITTHQDTWLAHRSTRSRRAHRGAVAIQRLRGDPLREVLRIIANTGQPARAPGVEPRQTQDVDALDRGDAADVTRVAATVEDRDLDPAPVG